MTLLCNESLKQRGKNETKLNVNKNMRAYLLCMKKDVSTVYKKKKREMTIIEELYITPLGRLVNTARWPNIFRVPLDEKTKSNLKLLKDKIL